MHLLQRELSIALRARVTWLQAALSALLVGHSFVLAVDIYAAGSRSALTGGLMTREFDPLLGIVRPTLGGLYLAVSLLGPITAARPLATEKERHTWAMLLLHTGAPLRVVAAKFVAAAAAVGVQCAAPLALLATWLAVGGHLGGGETAVALSGEALYLLLIAAVATAAAAWSANVAQAATATLIVVAASWAIDASEGFAALAWLGRALDWSVTTHLEPSERGTLLAGAWLWMAVAVAGSLALAYIGARLDFTRTQRAAAAVGVVAATLLGCAAAARVRRGVDVTELHRASLPAAAVAGLQTISGPLVLEVYLDRDDARRQQLEADVVAKLRLARPDLTVSMPEDEQSVSVTANREEGYGRIVMRAGGGERVTYSGSRSEIVSLFFEAAGLPLPDWSAPEYPGYPRVVDGERRNAIAVLAYVAIPAALLAIGWLTRPTSMRRNPS
jgi:hypothetical protein